MHDPDRYSARSLPSLLCTPQRMLTGWAEGTCLPSCCTASRDGAVPGSHRRPGRHGACAEFQGELLWQVLVVVTTNWQVMCFDHNLQRLWSIQVKVGAAWGCW